MGGAVGKGAVHMRMFVDPPAIYLCRQTMDFRKSINGLALIVEQSMARNPFDAALYLFTNRARDKMKILYWDATGFALWYKRLERNRFKWPCKNNTECMELNEQQLQWLLGGFDIIGHAPFFLSAA